MGIPDDLERKFRISRAGTEELEAVSELIASVIEPLAYYSEAARCA